MVSNETISTINYIKDLETETNIKYLLLALLFLYSIVSIYISFKWDNDEAYAIIIKNFIMRIPSTIFLFFFPFMTIFLFRSVSWELIYGFMLTLFTYYGIVIMVVSPLGFWTFFAGLIGLKTKTEKVELRIK